MNAVVPLAMMLALVVGAAAAAEPAAGTPPAPAPSANAAPASADSGEDATAPHTPTLVFYLAQLTVAGGDAMRTALAALPSARLVAVDAGRRFVRVRFDSHIVSYHQVAQALSDAGATIGQQAAPRLVIAIPDYAQDAHAAAVDAILAGKRLNQRVTITVIDRARGLFAIAFLPLQADAQSSAPQGFNGGHLHHPLHDPPPRGLGLACTYLADDDRSIDTALLFPQSTPAAPAKP
jgi:hypothetical protein